MLRDKRFLYGYPKSHGWWRKLKHHHYEQVRIDNLLAERTAEACSIMQSLGRGFATEQPSPLYGSVSMFEFDSFKDIIAKGGKIVYFDQCMHGAPTRKRTMVLHDNCDFSSLEATYNHPASL